MRADEAAWLGQACLSRRLQTAGRWRVVSRAVGATSVDYPQCQRSRQVHVHPSARRWTPQARIL